MLIVEGEKAADAATRLLPGMVVVTSPNGSKSAGKADWSPLKAREVAREALEAVEVAISKRQK